MAAAAMTHARVDEETKTPAAMAEADEIAPTRPTRYAEAKEL